LFVPKINGYYSSPGTFITDARRSIQSRLKIYKRQPQLSNVCEKPILDSFTAHSMIARAISEGGAFAAGRVGTVEGDLLSWQLRRPKRTFPAALLRNGKTLAGIFPADNHTASTFAETYNDACANLDLLGVRNHDFFSGYFDMERTIIEHAEPRYLCSIDELSPLGASESWIRSLVGKKVLVIHPFGETIKKQYKQNRHEIYPDRNWLPDFDLSVYKPFQTAGKSNPISGPKNWPEALQFMLDDISGLTFDIALISAGAYGLPLAAGIKKSGKTAIHVGGVLQLFFGIRGGRWDQVSSHYSSLTKYNSKYWVRPTRDETPEWSKSVEGGAYW
jgi:hypothetical protein